jgi:hypothetical protein
MTEHSAETPSARPLLRVVRGAPDDVELAALAAVVATALSAPAAPEPAPATRSLWADRAALLRRPLTPGPNAWRGSALTR